MYFSLSSLLGCDGVFYLYPRENFEPARGGLMVVPLIQHNILPDIETRMCPASPQLISCHSHRLLPSYLFVLH